MSGGSPIEPFLEKLELHSHLGPDERDCLRNLPTSLTRMGQHEDFVRPGDTVEHACLVVEGLVGRFAIGVDGARQTTGLHVAGDWVDLYSVVVPRVGRALQTLTPATMLRVPHNSLRKAAHDHPLIAEAFWRECVIEAAILGEWIVNLGNRKAPARVANLLCELACRLKRSPLDSEQEYSLPLTQQQLADILGLTVVHVNRTLKLLREDELVVLRNHHVTILDWDRLCRLGEFSADYLALGKTVHELAASAPDRSPARAG